MGFILDLPFGLLVLLAIGVAQAVVFILGLIHGNIAFWVFFIFALLWFGGIYVLGVNQVASGWIITYLITVWFGTFWAANRIEMIPYGSLPGGDQRLGFLAIAVAYAAFALWKFIQWSVAIVFLSTPILLVLVALGFL